MRTQLLPKVFEFTEEYRPDIVLSDPTKIQLDSLILGGVVTLMKNADGFYPTDSDLFVISKATTPGAWKRWHLLTVGVVHAHVGNVAVTSHKVRLHNGTNHYYWSGAAWVVAGASDWNTEAQVNANIQQFNHKTIRVVVNLQTSDRRYTPTLSWVRMAWRGSIYFWEDIIYRSLVRALKSNVMPIADHPFDVAAATSTINLNSYPVDSSFDIADVDSVFNHTTDPDHMTDLLSSYNPGTKVITLTGSFPAGNRCWVRFIYRPKVVVIQGTDYHALASVPAIVLEDFREVGSRPLADSSGVLDRATGAVVLFQEAYYTDLRFGIVAIAPGGVDSLRLNEEMLAYFHKNPLIRSTGLDELYRLMLVSEFADESRAEFSDVRTVRATAEIKGVLSHLSPALTEASGMAPVRRIRLVGDFGDDIPVAP